MSFQFGFSSQDLSNDEFGDQQNGGYSNSDANGAPEISTASALDAAHLRSAQVKQPKWECLEDTLKSLVDVRVSFEKVLTPQRSIPLYRRELFDVKHQLMTESEEKTDEDAKVELEILIGETNEDLRKNVYEGGLKSWECSIDLVDALSDSVHRGKNRGTIVELGCGTSLPSEYLFSQLLSRSAQPCDVTFILADYNESVLRLVSLPNFIITWAMETLSLQELTGLQQSNNDSVPVVENELLFTEALLQKFQEDIFARGISLKLLSGSWGRTFHNVLDSALQNSSSELLLLSSETIYQPDMLPVISDLILQLLQDSQSRQQTATALVAAKDIYFGVGGSVIEFQNYIQKRITTGSLSLAWQTFKVQAGLKRSIVSIYENES
ncbi:LAME_0D05490g1_1 [Lachancea meyersii CBS 8951]|uniref:protein-histidine N-methyltransferase n=1 Tax=Lachancea meyersii CBS 8951 TaxID=1266667 RepID=A0A1G4J957_9SACH|nr:LAME_0D05490g1_1 [Lachancea meyersii CBS 8951]